MVEFRRFADMIAEQSFVEEGLKDGYHITNHHGEKTGAAHYKDSKSAIRDADRLEDNTGRVHTVHHVKDGKIVKQWQFRGGHQDQHWGMYSDHKGEPATSHIRESAESIDENEEKEYTVAAEISHPFNRGLSVTKHFKHAAKSPEEAVKKAKNHIKGQGWKVHSASVRGSVNEDEEVIDLVAAIEEAAETIEELRGTTLKSYAYKATADNAYNPKLKRVVGLGRAAKRLQAIVRKNIENGDDPHKGIYEQLEMEEVNFAEAIDLIDEISKQTLLSYVKKTHKGENSASFYKRGAKKFAKDVDHLRSLADKEPEGSPIAAGMRKTAGSFVKTGKKFEHKAKGREEGLKKAEKRLTKEDVIAELSKNLLGSYMKKSQDDVAKHRNISKIIDPEGKADTPMSAHHAKKQYNRYRGMDNADGKLKGDKYTKVKAT